MFISWIKEDFKGGIATPFICLMTMITLSFIYFLEDYYHKQDILKMTTNSYLCETLFFYGEEETKKIEKGQVVTINYTVGQLVIDKQSDSSIYSMTCYLKSGYQEKKIINYST